MLNDVEYSHSFTTVLIDVSICSCASTARGPSNLGWNGSGIEASTTSTTSTTSTASAKLRRRAPPSPDFSEASTPWTPRRAPGSQAETEEN